MWPIYFSVETRRSCGGWSNMYDLVPKNQCAKQSSSHPDFSMFHPAKLDDGDLFKPHANFLNRIVKSGASTETIPNRTHLTCPIMYDECQFTTERGESI